MTSTVPSLEPPSTTMTSTAGPSWASTLSMLRPIVRSALRTAMTTLYSPFVTPAPIVCGLAVCRPQVSCVTQLPPTQSYVTQAAGSIRNSLKRESRQLMGAVAMRRRTPSQTA